MNESCFVQDANFLSYIYFYLFLDIYVCLFLFKLNDFSKSCLVLVSLGGNMCLTPPNM